MNGVIATFIFCMLPALGLGQNAPSALATFACKFEYAKFEPSILSLQHGRFGCPGDAKRNLSFHVGPAIPHGSLSNRAAVGLAVTVDSVFPITPVLSWDLRTGYSRFPGRNAQPTRVVDLTVNLDYVVLRTRPWLFVNGGLGSYFVTNFDPAPGFNVGTGLGYPLTSRIVGEITYNFHKTVNTPSDIRFSKLQAGIIFSF